MLSLSQNELVKVILTCENPRDKALIMFMADSGLRRAEVVALNWSDLNMENGLCHVNSGKGGKPRVTVVSATTRQAMLKYRDTLSNAEDPDPLIQSRKGTRFTPDGLFQVFCRLSKRGGIHVTPHSMRRTFVKLSLRAKMDPLHLKELLGHETLEMVMYYAGEFDDEELIEAHEEHSPIEHLNLTPSTNSSAIPSSSI
jgi:integrase